MDQTKIKERFKYIILTLLRSFLFYVILSLTFSSGSKLASLYFLFARELILA